MDILDAPAALAGIEQRLFLGSFASAYPAGIWVDQQAGVQRDGSQGGFGRAIRAVGGSRSEAGVGVSSEVGAEERLGLCVAHLDDVAMQMRRLASEARHSPKGRAGFSFASEESQPSLVVAGCAGRRVVELESAVESGGVRGKV